MASFEPVCEIVKTPGRKSGGNQRRIWPFHITQDSLILNPWRWLLLFIAREDEGGKGMLLFIFNLKQPVSVIKIEFVISNDKFLAPICPSSVCCSVPVAASQILIVRSRDADASSFESAEKATERTQSLCPSSVWRTAFHSRSVFGSCRIQSGV